MDTVRMALVGCGKLGSGRAKLIPGVDGLTLTAAMDIVPDKARAVAEATGARATDDFAAVVEAEDVDAVYVATPHALHAPQTIAAARHGKHVLVEKPLATTREDALAIIRCCRTAQVTLGLGYQNRFLSGAGALRGMVRDQGILGELMYVRHGKYGWAEPDPRWTRTWRGDPAQSGGGGLFDSGTHYIDLMRYVTGLEPEEVFCRWAALRSPPGVDDVASVLVRYRGVDTVGQLDVAASVAGGERIKVDGKLYGTAGMDLYGVDGHIFWEGFTNVYLTHGTQDIPAQTWTRLPYERVNQSALLLEDFARAVREGREPIASGADGLATVDFVLAAYESGRRGEPVALENRHLAL